MPSNAEKLVQAYGLHNVGDVYWNQSTPRLYEHAVARGEGSIAHLGPLVVRTGEYTGRSPNDKFIVREPSSEKLVWWSDANHPLTEEQFDRLFARMRAYLQGKDLFVQDCHAGADPQYTMPIRVITQFAWQSLFARNMFIRPHDMEAENHQPQFTVVGAPGFRAVPEVDGTNSEAFVVLNYARRLVLIGGTHYAGEIKKSIFTVMNFLLPQKDVLSMHCSANVGHDGDAALFFGLSGTGKTTLSADPARRLIGDDEHGWSKDGIFNFEGGCYAKVIRLSPEAEPDIYTTTRQFGTILENVGMDQGTRRLDLNDAALTENTRAAYPLSHIENSVPEARAGHPRNVVLLTCDAFGVLPPVARLTPEQASYHFMVGYTAKVAGTERGSSGAGPKATFSTCFGAPFMALHPSIYAELLATRIREKGAQCWLVNTGWTGGPFGVGARISIGHTRALVNAILSGELAGAACNEDPVFGLQVPTSCTGVPDELLTPRLTWQDPDEYDRTAKDLASSIVRAFEPFAAKAGPEIVAAGPRV